MDPVVLVIFGAVYLGMLLGEIPGLRLDRSGIALLGAIALLASGRIDPMAARDAIDVATIGLLLGLMVISAQFRLGGCYAWITRHLVASPWSPPALLAALLFTAGGLSALLANDIVCLAMAPILVEACVQRGLRPLPFLVGLACAANVGSAATLIGNPQNMLIGQTLHLSFAHYLWIAGVPTAVCLAVTWLLLVALTRGHWHERSAAAAAAAKTPPFNPWQTLKGSAVLVAVVVLFLVAPWPREVVALAGAGVLLMSRRMASREILGLVDWHLLILFIGLFIVNDAVRTSGWLAHATDAAARAGLPLEHPATLFGAAALLSNLVSNVPAVMLLLPSATHPLAGPVLALSSTLAGNLIIVGSIANIIVVEQAGRMGVPIRWGDHARLGVPVTLATLAIAAIWLVFVAHVQPA